MLLDPVDTKSFNGDHEALRDAVWKKMYEAIVANDPDYKDFPPSANPPEWTETEKKKTEVKSASAK
jgi:hypothetical protein